MAGLPRRRAAGVLAHPVGPKHRVPARTNTNFGLIAEIMDTPLSSCHIRTTSPIASPTVSSTGETRNSIGPCIRCRP
jgi:hypothetical protein